MPWGERIDGSNHASRSNDQVLKAEAQRMADDLAKAVMDWKDNPCDTNELMMTTRATEYRQIRAVQRGLAHAETNHGKKD